MTQGGGDVEQRNFTYATRIFSRVVTEALREVFIREWNTLYPTTPWDDTRNSGRMLYNVERPRPRAKEYLPKYYNGNTKDWDFTILIDAILYSISIGTRLDTQVVDALNKLRLRRNKVFHSASDKIETWNFSGIVKEVKECFAVLKISTNELDDVLLEKSKYTSFKVLPSGPESDDESDELKNEIVNIMVKLESAKIFFIYTELHSWLLNLLGKRWFNTVQETSIRNNFVMTLHGENEATMLESYKKFASNVDCDEGVVSKIMTSPLTTEEKIFSLKDEVKSKVKNWNSWLIIVTDVVDLKKTLRFLPRPDEDEWRNGKILISTSDVDAIPADNG